MTEVDNDVFWCGPTDRTTDRSRLKNHVLSLLCSRSSLTKQFAFVSGERSAMIQTLNATESAAPHLMPRCERNAQEVSLLTRQHCCVPGESNCGGGEKTLQLPAE